jgi:cell division ATPase FtsA
MNISEEDIKKDPNALKRLKTQCEKAKKKLSDNKSTTITIFNFFKNNNLRLEITRETFNNECEDLYQKIIKILDKALLEAKFKEDNIDEVVLIGGSSRIPKIKQLLENKFSSKKVKDNINQDEAVAIGAAWQAYKLTNPSLDLKITDIAPSSLGVGVVSEKVEEQKNGKIMSFLIPKNSKIPIEKTLPYKTIVDNQEYFDVVVFSGENRFCKDNELLTHFIIDKLPKGPAGTIKLFITFTVDKNGILTINSEVSPLNENNASSQGSSVLRKTVKYSIYDDEVQDKNKKLKFSIRKEEKNKLEEIKKETDFIKEKQESFKSLQDNEEKIDFLNDLIESCLNIISIYESLNSENDSGCLDEKVFSYSKLLFKFYSQIIILENNNQNIENIVTKIKEILPKFINDNIENLIDIFDEVKIKKPKIYIDIILHCIVLLYKEGDKILEEKKPYSRYYSKKFYLKARRIKNYIDNDEKLKNKMNSNLNSRYKELDKYNGKVEEIDAFVESIKDLVQQKNIPYLPNKRGFTKFNEKIQKCLGELNEENNLYFLLDILQEMADSLYSPEKFSEVEAYCLATIIKINFSLLHNYDFKLYNVLIDRIDFIYNKIYEEDNENEELNEPNWHQEYTQLTKEINQKKKEMEKKIDNDKYIKEIKDTFSRYKKDEKFKEFLLYLLDKYPYIKYDPSKRKSFEQKTFEELFRIMFHEYHSDNYNGRDDYSIYNAIYELFVEMENYLRKTK